MYYIVNEDNEHLYKIVDNNGLKSYLFVDITKYRVQVPTIVFKGYNKAVETLLDMKRININAHIKNGI